MLGSIWVVGGVDKATLSWKLVVVDDNFALWTFSQFLICPAGIIWLNWFSNLFYMRLISILFTDISFTYLLSPSRKVFSQDLYVLIFIILYVCSFYSDAILVIACFRKPKICFVFGSFGLICLVLFSNVHVRETEVPAEETFPLQKDITTLCRFLRVFLFFIKAKIQIVIMH